MVKKFFRHFRRGEKGFTLIELMIALAIIGVLAAVAMPNITAMMGTAKKGADTTELQNVQVAVISAMADQKVGTIDAGPLTMDSPTIGPEAKTLAHFLATGMTLTRTYTVDASGNVTQDALP